MVLELPENNRNEFKQTDVRETLGLTDITTNELIEGTTNLYYTDARARASISETTTGLSYDSATGVLSQTSGYIIPTTTEQTNWGTAYTHSQNNSQAHTDYMLNTGDTATGNYNFATNTLFIDASNYRIGIGTASPADELSIYDTDGSDYAVVSMNSGTVRGFFASYLDRSYMGTSSNHPFYIYTNNTARMYFDVSGNVGIGTTVPSQKLDVYGTYGNPATSGTTQNGIFTIRNNDTYSSLYIGSSVASPYAMWLQASARNALGTNYPLALNPNGGNVGIGTTAPQKELEISKSGGATLRITNSYNTLVPDDYVGGIEFWNNDADTPKVGSYIKSYAAETYGRKGYMTFGVSVTNNTDAVEIMRISEGGNVGIGTAAPAQMLSVGANSEFNVRSTGVMFPVQAATASAPTYVKGGIYFDTTLNKLRVGGATAWETITSV